MSSERGCMEPTEVIDSPGKYLKEKRESLRLSLNNVAKETRIREAVLKAIEEDNYGDLPRLYVKSFLRAYADCLNLDPNEVILLYQRYLENLPPSKGQVSKHSPASAREIIVRPLLIFVSMVLTALLVYACFKLLPRFLHL